jgi:hypothetical protein
MGLASVWINSTITLMAFIGAVRHDIQQNPRVSPWTDGVAPHSFI